MKPSLLLSLILLVTLPLVGLAWLGWRMMDGERARLRENFSAVMQQRLAEVNGTLAETIATTERKLTQAFVTSGTDAETFRELARSHPLVEQIFFIDATGKRIYPSLVPALCSNQETEFLTRSAEIWKSGDRLDRALNETGTSAAQGWKVWFHGGGTRFWFWQRGIDGSLLGAEVPSAVFMAELLTALPTANDNTAAFRLADAHGREVYGWGQVSAPAVSVKQPAPAPLGTWSVTCEMPDIVAQGSEAWRYQLWLGLGSAALLLGLVAWYLYRESVRELRLASQRVSFVNQVSHELKTPLTNISLYAELAAQKLPPEAQEAQEYLTVVTSEGARLGRLINNVLTFAKHQRGQVQPRLSACDVVALLHRSVDQFRPGLANKQVRLETQFPASLTVVTDADMLEQIVGNLLSNVEKYGGAGGVAWVRLSTTSDEISIEIEDRGPGVPVAQQERIFTPFVRLSDKLSDGITGTGIGLSIAREITGLLGGTLHCHTPTGGVGALFILKLPRT